MDEKYSWKGKDLLKILLWAERQDKMIEETVSGPWRTLDGARRGIVGVNKVRKKLLILPVGDLWV